MRYTLCQTLADGRSRKKFKTLGFKSRFLEEVLASHSMLTFCSFASKHIVFLGSRFLYSSFLLFFCPLIFMLPYLSPADFFTFLHLLLDCPNRKFPCPASQLYLEVWGQSCSASLQAWSIACSVQINSSRNVN